MSGKMVLCGAAAGVICRFKGKDDFSCDVVVACGSLGILAGAARVGLVVSVVLSRLNMGEAGSVLAKRLVVSGEG